MEQTFLAQTQIRLNRERINGAIAALGKGARNAAREIDNGFILISRRRAEEIVFEHKLPRMGYERTCRFGPYAGWVTRTLVNGRARWAVFGVRLVEPEEVQR